MISLSGEFDSGFDIPYPTSLITLSEMENLIRGFKPPLEFENFPPGSPRDHFPETYSHDNNNVNALDGGDDASQ